MVDACINVLAVDAVIKLFNSHKMVFLLAGKTYRFCVHNVGISTSLNFRIQNHNLLLVETEGSYTVQQNYTNMDIHVSQSYSLVSMDQNASTDYYIVTSAALLMVVSGIR